MFAPPQPKTRDSVQFETIPRQLEGVRCKAPEWTRAARPLVLLLLLIVVSVVITIIFRADVDAQAGAYATAYWYS